MMKKIMALLLVIFGTLIMLPFGFGLWNDDIGIQGQITIAGTESVAPENEAADNTASPQESTNGDTEDSSENSERQEIEGENSSDGTQASQSTDESKVITSPDVCADDKPPVPQPLQPVEGADSESSQS